MIFVEEVLGFSQDPKIAMLVIELNSHLIFLILEYLKLKLLRHCGSLILWKPALHLLKNLGQIERGVIGNYIKFIRRVF